MKQIYNTLIISVTQYFNIDIFQYYGIPIRLFYCNTIGRSISEPIMVLKVTCHLRESHIHYFYLLLFQFYHFSIQISYLPIFFLMNFHIFNKFSSSSIFHPIHSQSIYQHLFFHFLTNIHMLKLFINNIFMSISKVNTIHSPNKPTINSVVSPSSGNLKKNKKQGGQLSEPDILQTKKPYGNDEIKKIDKYIQCSKSILEWPLSTLVDSFVRQRKFLHEQIEILKKQINSYKTHQLQQIIFFPHHHLHQVSVQMSKEGKTIMLNQLLSKYQNLKAQNKKIKQDNELLKIKKKCGCSIHVKEDQIAKLLAQNRKLQRKLKQNYQKQISQINFKNNELKIINHSFNGLKQQLEDILIQFSQQKIVSQSNQKQENIIERACQNCLRNENLYKNYNEVVGLMEQLEKEKDIYEQKIQELHGKLINCQDVICNLKDEVQRNGQIYAKIRQQNAQLINILHQVQEKNRQLTQINESHSQQSKQTSKNIYAFVQQVQDANKNLLEKDKQIKCLKTDLHKLENEIRRLFAELKDTKEMEQAVKYVSADMIGKLVGEIDILEKTNSVLRNTLSCKKDMEVEENMSEKITQKKYNMYRTQYEPEKKSYDKMGLSLASDMTGTKSE